MNKTKTQNNMKKFYFIVIIIAAMVIGTSSCARRAEAQTQNTTQVADTTTDDEGFNPNIDRGEMTEYTDTIKGVVYPIYLSKGGKAFIWRKSKKTGKEYKQYRPEKGKQINPEAYK